MSLQRSLSTFFSTYRSDDTYHDKTRFIKLCIGACTPYLNVNHTCKTTIEKLLVSSIENYFIKHQKTSSIYFHVLFQHIVYAFQTPWRFHTFHDCDDWDVQVPSELKAKYDCVCKELYSFIEHYLNSDYYFYITRQSMYMH